MSDHYNIPKEIYTDEAIRFIADRHHITPKMAVQASITKCEGASSLVGTESGPVPHLEANEVEIIKGLIAAYRKKITNLHK